MSTTVEIVKTPEVLHGKPRIEGTRIGVRMIGESIREGGQTIAKILEGYPDLTREQVEAALSYYDDHPDEMNALRAEEEAILRRVSERNPTPDTGA